MRCRSYGLVYVIFLDKLPDEFRIILSQVFVTLIQMLIVARLISVLFYVYAAICELFPLLFLSPRDASED